MRMLLAGLGLCLSGCYVTGQVAPGVLRDAGDHLGGPAVLRGEGSRVLLEPGTMVRARLADGDRTGWVEASTLRATPEGLMVGEPLPAAAVAEVKVTDLDRREVELLRETAPSGGRVGQSWRFTGQYQLQAPGPEAFAWARRFSERALAEGKRGGRWQLSTSSGWELFRQRPPLEARNLVEAGSPTAAFAPGFRWSEVSQLELRSLDPFFSAMTVPLFPFAMLAVAMDEKGTNRVISATEGEGEGSAPMLTWSGPDSRPLFTGRARRRAIVQALATVDAQSTLGGDLSSGLAVGLRFHNFYEFAVVGRGLSLRAGPDGRRSGLLAMGAQLGLHVDGEGDGRFAFSLGMEVAGGRDATAVQFKWGPRLGLGGSLFLTISPLNVSILRLGRDEQSVARFVSSLELGGTL